MRFRGEGRTSDLELQRDVFLARNRGGVGQPGGMNESDFMNREYAMANEALQSKLATEKAILATQLLGNDEYKNTEATLGRIRDLEAQRTLNTEEWKAAVADLARANQGGFSRMVATWKNAFAQWRAGTMDFKQSAELLAGPIDMVGSRVTAMAQSVLSGTQSMSQAFKGMVRSMISDISALILKMLVYAAIGAAIGWFTGMGPAMGARIGAGVAAGDGGMFKGGGDKSMASMGAPDKALASMGAPSGVAAAMAGGGAQAKGGDTYIFNVQAIDGEGVARVVQTPAFKRGVRDTMVEAKTKSFSVQRAFA